MVQNKPVQKKSDEGEVSNNSIDPAQIRCIMIGVGMLLLMNLVLSVGTIVLGMTVKSELDEVQEELSPLVEAITDMRETVENGPAPPSF